MKKSLLLRLFVGSTLAASLAVAPAMPVFAAPASGPSAAPLTGLPDFTQLIDRAGPAVVNIRTTERVTRAQRGGLPPGMDDDMAELFRRFFGIPMPQPGPKGGSPRRGSHSHLTKSKMLAWDRALSSRMTATS